MPPVITMSAHLKSAAVTSSELRLISRMFQPFGSMAASVIMPSGGAGARAPQTSHTDARLQNEFGLKRGNTINTFGGRAFRTIESTPGASRTPPRRIRQSRQAISQSRPARNISAIAGTLRDQVRALRDSAHYTNASDLQ